MIPKEVLITSQDLVEWIDRPPSNDDLDLCNYLENAVKNQYKYKNVIDRIKEYIKHYETIRGYYEYEENGYDEYIYVFVLKKVILELLEEVK